MEKNKQHYANTQNPTISAIINGTFLFKEEAKAIEKLESLREYFTCSKDKHEEGEEEVAPPKPCVMLWVRDYDITEDELEKGVMGNFAFVTYEKNAEGLFSLTATKIDTELKYHPRRKRLPQRHPNWGHPILRNVKKSKVYPSVEAAQKELQNLHLEHPDTSIPSTASKLYVMIYSRAEDPSNPIQKYVLEIKTSHGGGFLIEARINDYTPKMGPNAKKGDGEEGDEVEQTESAPQGYFTSMLELKRKK